jgi:hypothetical protein
MWDTLEVLHLEHKDELHERDDPRAERGRDGRPLSQNLLNYDGPHVPVIVIMTFDSYTYVPHNIKGLLSSEQDPIIGVLQYYNSLFKITSE